MQRPVLTIIHSTHASLGGFKETGLLERHCRLLKEYTKTFNVLVYSSDSIDYSSELEVQHKPVPWLPKAFGWRHLIFYLWLVWQAPRMQGVIKVLGSNIPTLPLVKWLSGRPMMVTYQFDYAQGTRSSEKSLLKYLLAPFLERMALSPADLVLVTADWLDEKVKKVYHKKTVLLPNWVDLEAVKLLEKNKQRKNDLILYAGRLHWLKGVNVLIEAFVQIKQNHPQARLLICGTGDERERLERLVESLGVRDVEFLGRLSHAEVLQLMISAAVFVLPTLTMEGHPKALIEAMACGMACVVSNVPGNRNVILDGRNGLVVPPGDAPVLAETLNTLLEDQSLCFQLGRSAMEDATQFDFRYIVTAEIDVLLGLDDTSPSRKPR